VFSVRRCPFSPFPQLPPLLTNVTNLRQSEPPPKSQSPQSERSQVRYPSSFFSPRLLSLFMSFPTTLSRTASRSFFWNRRASFRDLRIEGSRGSRIPQINQQTRETLPPPLFPSSFPHSLLSVVFFFLSYSDEGRSCAGSLSCPFGRVPVFMSGGIRSARPPFFPKVAFRKGLFSECFPPTFWNPPAVYESFFPFAEPCFMPFVL